MSLKREIKELALSQGAQLVGVTRVEVYAEYLAEVERRTQDTGAQLADFMISPVSDHTGRVISEDTSFFARLSDARQSLPSAKTIILLGVYAYDETAVYDHTRRELRGKTARIYNYYPVVRDIAKRVVASIEARGYRAIQGQHIPLKYVADRMGLGVYGKNGVFQTARYGSYVALRDVLTDLELEPDPVESTRSPCDACDRCLRACPTGALYAPYQVNPKLCLNPVTRSRTYIQPQVRSKMQNWISGCDICQEVCPSNSKLRPRQVDPRSGFDSRHHASHRNLDGLEKTPLLASLLAPEWPEIIRRNAAISLGNIGRGRNEAWVALQKGLEGAPPGLEEYFIWALDELESRRA
jgi:epoxyqueuosine reductase